MSLKILLSTLIFPAVALADFSISVELEEPTTISSSLTLKNQNCIGRNQKTEIKHPKKICDRIFADYKELFNKVPDTVPAGSDEPTAQVKVSSGPHKWSRTIGRVSGNSPANQRLRALTNEILKLNAK